MESGWFRQRKMFPEYGSSVNLTWVMDTEVFFTWSDWMEANGHDWFVMALDDYGEGKQEYELRLSTDISFEYDDSDVVTCSATGELGSPLFGRGSQIPPEELECVPAYIIRAPECIITPLPPPVCDAYELALLASTATDVWPGIHNRMGRALRKPNFVEARQKQQPQLPGRFLQWLAQSLLEPFLQQAVMAANAIAKIRH